MKYQPSEIEPKWRQYWEENGTYRADNDSDKPKYYVLDMFPYPSGSGLHVGHPLGYIASDIVARHRRLTGYNVLHPMGYDAFGLPAEQYAIQTGVHPAISTAENMARYREQLDKLGFSFDWDRMVNTSDPAYYKWTQWLFLQLFEHWYDTAQQQPRPVSELRTHLAAQGTEGLLAAATEPLSLTAAEWAAMSAKEQSDVLMNYRLAYRQVTYVNWCEALGTVLANDEVKDGRSERGNHPVERKPMLQWSLRITAYAQRLLDDLDKVAFSEAMKKMQANWIGRSEGAQLFFELADHDGQLEIFTTRPDTIFGATFMVLAPEHELVAAITTAAQQTEIDDYLHYTSHRSERERMAEVKEVSGAFTGAYALNPFNGARIPIYIAEYVLKDYGTGAIMAVPADDERDQRFAEKYELAIVPVIDKSMYPGAGVEDKLGKMINSDFLNDLEVPDAIELMLQRIEEMEIGKRQINFRLRDAIYSRQRYWGEPFPIVYDPDGVAHALPVEELPLVLPELDDFKPASGGRAPLARKEEWVNLPNGWTRETDTMPGFAGSSWYFLRYMDPGNPNEFASQSALHYWGDVDLYVGGTEHAVGHLMYSRFWHKFLYDNGYVPTPEPYQRLINQGMIQGTMLRLHLAGLVDAQGNRHPIWVNADTLDATAHTDADLGEGRLVLDDLARQRLIPLSFGTEVTHNNVTEQRVYEKDLANLAASADTNADYLQSMLAQAAHYAWKTDEQGERYLLLSHEIGKMSKSKYNVINPDDIVARYGADCFRMYEMFLGPVEQGKPWNTNSIDGVSRFLRKFWGLFFDADDQWLVSDAAPTREELKILHTAIKKVTDDIDRFSLNTCISAFMVATNDLAKEKSNNSAVLQQLVVLMAPFAPYITEELWHRLGNAPSVHQATWPQLNETYLIEDTITMPIAINGKTRLTLDFAADTSKEEMERQALALEAVQKHIEGKTVHKVIVVPKRMINVVVR